MLYDTDINEKEVNIKKTQSLIKFSSCVCLAKVSVSLFLWECFVIKLKAYANNFDFKNKNFIYVLSELKTILFTT